MPFLVMCLGVIFQELCKRFCWNFMKLSGKTAIFIINFALNPNKLGTTTKLGMSPFHIWKYLG